MSTTTEEVSVSKFKCIGAEWNGLAARHRLPTVSHDWMVAALASLDPNDKPRLVIHRSSRGELIAGACLVEEENARYLRFLGNYPVPEPTYLVARDVEAEQNIIRAIRSLGMPLNLDRVPVELCDLRQLRGAFGPAALRIVRAEGGSPWLPLDGSWAAFESSLSPQRRSDLRRAQKKAVSRGPLTFELIGADEGSADEMLERYITLERDSWKFEAGTAIELDRKAARFFHALTRTQLNLRFGFLRIGELTVAGQIMVDYADTHWVLKTAFHQDFRNCSPGVLLMHEAIKSAFEQGRRAFEFLGFEEPWLSVWTRGVREYRTVRLYTYSSRGASVLCQAMWEGLKRRLRPAPSVAIQS